jgi:N-acetylglucosaminyldiphosphoundecaprenol N-acetyl-beta-D-mannosaminyltransferase
MVFEETTREPAWVRPLHIAEPARDRIDLAGVLIDQLDLSSAVRRIRWFLDSGGTHQVVTVNLDFISIAQRDPAFRATINEADLAVADGMPLVWVSRLKGRALAQRVAGVELVDQSCQLAAELGRSVFLLGAAPGVAEAAGRTMEERYPGLRVADVYAPPFGPISRAEDDLILQRIQHAAPDFLFVALGAPRQDLWIRAHHGRLHVPVAMGVGCVLDLLAGVVRRAPAWM